MSLALVETNVILDFLYSYSHNFLLLLVYLVFVRSCTSVNVILRITSIVGDISVDEHGPVSSSEGVRRHVIFTLSPHTTNAAPTPAQQTLWL